MSKDKGTKNIKKAPADRTSGKKVVSAYKSESKSGSGVQKTDVKKEGGGKKS